MVIEDKQYLTILDDMAMELHSNLVVYNGKAMHEAEKDKLIAMRIEQNELLFQTLKKHRRTLEFMRGQKIEPEMHFGEAVLLPAGGMK